jgi:uncharacterized UBP type Zn finger protein
LADGLLTEKYAVEPETDESTKEVMFEGIKPQMFKTLIGKGHPDFSSKRQQDAQEFFLHIVNLLEVVDLIFVVIKPDDILSEGQSQPVESIRLLQVQSGGPL